VAKPVPDVVARPAVDALVSSPEGRALMSYIWQINSSWDLLYGDRMAVRRLMDDKAPAGN
jgi:hypothetical protein